MSTTPTPPATTEDVEPPGEPTPVGQRPPMGERWLRALAWLAVPLASFAAVWWSILWSRDTGTSRLIVVVVVLAIGVGAVFAAYLGLDRAVNQLSLQRQETFRPWVFVGPSLLLLVVFLLYPAINTIILSFQNATSTEWVGLANYEFIFTENSMLRAIRNSILWMLIVPAGATAIGLVFATLADRLRRGEALSKSLIFLPMAISFVGASVVWGFIYDFRAFGNQTGLLNGIWTALGNDAIAWTSQQPWNNLFLMVIMIWMQTGFAMVILSAAVKSVPEDIIEAARIDGATEFQVFIRVIIPSIMSAIVVVMTTLTINVLKIFDIVWVMTGGQTGTEIIPERMVRQFFTNRNAGQGAAIAVILFALVLPVMVWNVKRFRAEEEIR